jgi:hypothetical protein
MASKGTVEPSRGKRSKNGRSSEVTAQLEWERDKRARLGVPGVAGGFLYLFGAVIIGSALGAAPTVGLLQGMAPALGGVASSHESPRAPEVRYISHHAFPLIAGSVLSAIALLALTGVVFVLVKATRFRRPESWTATLPLLLIGGFGFAAVSIGHQIAGAILTHQFATGSDFSDKAVDYALTNAGVNVAMQYISLLAGLSLTVGLISANLGAMRAGLLTRWLGVVGIFAALLIFLPIGGETLTLIPAFWLAAMGLLYMDRWPGEEPPAWEAGEARPWPTQAEMRAARQAGASDDPAVIENGSATGAAAGLAPSAGGKRRRKRGSRG